MNLPIQPLDETSVPSGDREWSRQAIIDPCNANFRAVQAAVSALPVSEYLTLVLEKNTAAPYYVETSATRAPREVRIATVRNLENADDTSAVSSAPFALWVFTTAAPGRTQSRIKILTLLGGFSSSKKYEVTLEVVQR